MKDRVAVAGPIIATKQPMQDDIKMLSTTNPLETSKNAIV